MQSSMRVKFIYNTYVFVKEAEHAIDVSLQGMVSIYYQF